MFTSTETEVGPALPRNKTTFSVVISDVVNFKSFNQAENNSALLYRLLNQNFKQITQDVYKLG